MLLSATYRLASAVLSAALFLAAAGCGGGSTFQTTGTTTLNISTGAPNAYTQQAQAGVAALQQWYSQGTGLYASPAG
jgi:hypothetical protein